MDLIFDALGLDPILSAYYAALIFALIVTTVLVYSATLAPTSTAIDRGAGAGDIVFAVMSDTTKAITVPTIRTSLVRQLLREPAVWIFTASIAAAVPLVVDVGCSGSISVPVSDAGQQCPACPSNCVPGDPPDAACECIDVDTGGLCHGNDQ